jgi:putative ABC transport system permease protein
MTARLMRLLRRLLNAARPERAEEDLARELTAHLTLLEDDLQRRGMNRDEARRAARLALGGIEQTKERHRDARSVVWLDDLRRDLRHAVRMLRRNPIFAVTAALSLAIGIGANTTIFTIANALLFAAPSGVARPDRLVDIAGVMDGRPGLFMQLSYRDYLDIRERATTLDGVYGYGLGPQPMSLGGASGAERIFANLVTTSFFNVLGVRPAAGRLFDDRDSEQAGASPMVILSHNFWMRRFGLDPTVVGRTLELNGHPFTVVGVAPDGFQGTNIAITDVWAPVAMVDIVMRTGSTGGSSLLGRHGFLLIGGRLKPGVRLPRAASEIEAIGRALERESPVISGRHLRLSKSSPIPEVARVPVSAFLGLLMAIVSVVLVIACANLASVLLARATARRREMAVRLAIGAGRARLVRQLLTETMLLFVLGGAAGLLLAKMMTMLIVRLIPALPLPVAVSLALDNRAVAFTSGLSLIAAVLCGLAPALHASKADVVLALKDESDGISERSRLRSTFVVAQVAFSIVLVIAAGLLLRALERAGSIDPGFDPHAIELAELDLSLAGYSDAGGRAFMRELIDRARRLPEVQSATAAALLPMGGGVRGAISLGQLTVPGDPAADEQRSSPPAFANIVEPSYFATLHIPLLAGRDFTDADDGSAPKVTVVGEATARRFWPGHSLRDAVGQYVLVQPFREFRAPGAGAAPASRPLTRLLIIGVARDVKYTSLRQDTPPLFAYVPLQQQYDRNITLVTRASPGRRTGAAVRALVASMNPDLPIVGTRTLEDGIALSLVPQRVAASVAGSLGAVGLLLAAIGIYGVTAYAVIGRTREIGIRIALGARPGNIVAMILGQGMTLVVTGSVIGLALAAAASRLLRTLLFGVAPLDPMTFSGAAVLFAMTGLAACYVPVRRATRIHAIEALRYE